MHQIPLCFLQSALYGFPLRSEKMALETFIIFLWICLYTYGASPVDWLGAPWGQRPHLIHHRSPGIRHGAYHGEVLREWGGEMERIRQVLLKVKGGPLGVVETFYLGFWSRGPPEATAP